MLKGCRISRRGVFTLLAATPLAACGIVNLPAPVSTAVVNQIETIVETFITSTKAFVTFFQQYIPSPTLTEVNGALNRASEIITQINQSLDNMGTVTNLVQQVVAVIQGVLGGLSDIPAIANLSIAGVPVASFFSSVASLGPMLLALVGLVSPPRFGARFRVVPADQALATLNRVATARAG